MSGKAGVRLNHVYGTVGRAGSCSNRPCYYPTCWRCFTCARVLCFECVRMHVPKDQLIYVGARDE